VVRPRFTIASVTKNFSVCKSENLASRGQGASFRASAIEEPFALVLFLFALPWLFTLFQAFH
jgi:hypothetical protein